MFVLKLDDGIVVLIYESFCFIIGVVILVISDFSICGYLYKCIFKWGVLI